MITRITPLIAIVGIVLLECLALLKGINGMALSGSVAAIGAIAGYLGKGIRDNRAKKKEDK